MKKIINSPESFVMEMCEGIVKAHPSLVLLPKYKVITRRTPDREKVSLISGGGSGHEPAHAGFVGFGMLDAAVCGDVFASPSTVQVYNGIKAVASSKGVLMIVKNYSGDCMNFNNAAALAKEDGIEVAAVYVNDDIAVKDSLYTVGRRGVAGTVFVHKIAGAAAERGLSLSEVQRIAQSVIDNVKSLGFALTSCTVPAKGSPTFEIGPDEMEFGVGIHGEPGRKREKIISADALAKRIIADLTEEAKLDGGEEIAVLINGFGGTPLQELYLFNNAVSKELESRGISVYKTLVGNYMTSIDMAGASVSILKLDGGLKELLDAPVDTPALRWGYAAGGKAALYAGAIEALAKALNIAPSHSKPQEDPLIPAKDEAAGDKKAFKLFAQSHKSQGKPSFGEKLNTEAFIKVIEKMADVIIANEVRFCEMDSVAGDGDFGMSIAKGFRQLKADWAVRDKSDIGAFLTSSGEVIMEYCGGASGPIWGSAFRGAGKSAAGKTQVSLSDIAELMQAAVKAVQETGERSFGRGAVVGDKTLIDALVPAADELTKAAKKGEKLVTALKLGAAAAVQGAENTKKIAARMGRAGTVGDRSIGHPDAGAYGLGVIFTELAAFVEKESK